MPAARDDDAATSASRRWSTSAISRVRSTSAATSNSRTSASPVRAAAISRDRLSNTHTHTDTHPFNGPLSGTTRVSRYQKGKTNLDFTEARDSEWQWHHLVHMQVCTSLQADNHASTPPLSFYRPSCRPTNSVKAPKARSIEQTVDFYDTA